MLLQGQLRILFCFLSGISVSIYCIAVPRSWMHAGCFIMALLESREKAVIALNLIVVVLGDSQWGIAVLNACLVLWRQTRGDNQTVDSDAEIERERINQSF